MDIGDIIFIFIVVLVIIGRVLSWVFKEFVEKAPRQHDGAQSGLMSQLGEWFKSLEQHVSQPVQSNDVSPSIWKKLEPEPVYSELQPTPQFELSDDIQNDSVTMSELSSTIKDSIKTKKQTPSKNVHSRRQLNLKDAIIHYEIIGPPLALRQEHNFYE